MIGHMRGTLLGRGNGWVLNEAGGVGYEVTVDRQTLAGLPPDGSEAALWVRTVVREDALALFGFDGAVRREAFDLLIGVSGIGAKTASQILGGMPLPDLVAAVREKDVGRLARLPGVGRKTAERLSLELSDKFLSLDVETPVATGSVPDRLLRDVRSALANLGFSGREVEAAVRGISAGPDDTLEDLIRKAVSGLGR